MLPWARWVKVPSPRTRHLNLILIVPVRSTTTTGMMGNLSQARQVHPPRQKSLFRFSWWSRSQNHRDISFPNISGDPFRRVSTAATPRKAPGRLNPPFRGCQKNRFQALPGAFLTPKRLPKRCENATVRSQVSNLIPQTPREAPGKLKPPFWGSQTNVFKASRGLF